MHIPTRTLVTACAFSAALLVAGCGNGNGDKAHTPSGSSGELFLQPVAAHGPDPFTDSTAALATTAPRVTRTPQSAPARGASPAAPQELRSLSGGTPGLYGGTRSAGSCDVEKQIGFLTSDQAKSRAFAQAAGISRAAVPGYLRGLTSVVLRADTRVTDHGFRDGQVTTFQSVLQVGTAVLVDNRGVPRVRCACGNPLNPPAAGRGNPGTSGRPWSGYRPTTVVAVTPAPHVITNITIINIVDNTWIERRMGDDGHRDVVVRSPDIVKPHRDPDRSSPGTGDGWSPGRGDHSSAGPSDHSSAAPSHHSSAAPSHHSSADPSVHSSPVPSPHDSSTSPSPSETSRPPQETSSHCLIPPPTVTATPGARGSTPTARTETEPATPGPTDCPTATVTAPSTAEPGRTSPAPTTTGPGTSPPPSADRSAQGAATTSPGGRTDQTPSLPDSTSDKGIGPDAVPETPDVPDGGGLIPDERPTTSSIFDSPTGVFGS